MIFYVFGTDKVLAQRGKYWTLLQNACRSLWNAAQSMLTLVVSETFRLTDDPLADGASNIEVLRKILWLPFFNAADFLLHMLVHVQNEVKLDSEHNRKVRSIEQT